MTATPRAIELVETAALAAADKLADGIIAYDVSDQLVITDAFLLCSASNDRQVRSIVDEIELRMRQAGAELVRREGEREGRWVLLDYLEVVVHVQHADERSFYALERIWKDCPHDPAAELVTNPGRPAERPGTARAVAARPDGLERRTAFSGAERHPARRDRAGTGRTGGEAAGRAASGHDRLLGPDRRPAPPPAGPADRAGGDRRQGPAGTARRPLGGPDRRRDPGPSTRGAHRWRRPRRAVPRGRRPGRRRAAAHAATLAERPCSSAGGSGLAVVVSHGAALRLGMSRVLGMPEELFGVLGPLSNCSWSVLGCAATAAGGWSTTTPARCPSPSLSDDR